MIRLARGRHKACWARCALALAACVLCPPRTALAQGGPPLITDDPDTPGPGYWEINLFGFLQRSREQRSWEVPRIDVNYGVGRRIQLKLEAPWLVARQAGEPWTSGPGNAVAGVKWRFLGEEAKRLAWSVYPQLEFNVSDASVRKRLVEDGHQLLLPTEFTAEFDPVELNLEVGRNFVEHGEDEWIYGLSTETRIAPRLEALAELHGEKRGSAAAEILYNLAARYKLTPRVTLMAAVGHAFRGPSEDSRRFLFLAGVQLNVPGTFKFGGPGPSANRSSREVVHSPSARGD